MALRDAGGEAFGNPLTHGGILQTGIFPSVRDKTYLDERRGTQIVMQHIVVAWLHSAAMGAVAARDFAQDVGREGRAARIIVIGLDSGGGALGGHVAMNAHEGGIGMGV